MDQRGVPADAPVRVGLIGFGFAGRVFHAPLIAGASEFTLAAICSRHAAQVQAEWPSVPVMPTPTALLARGDLDLVVIATPNDSHFALAEAALQAGLHVVVDKPFTLTLAEARALARLAESRGKLLTVFHNRRWDGDFLALQALLADGRLGRITHFESHFDRFRPQVVDRWRERAGPGGGLWFDLGPHLLDQALVLFGWPTAISLDWVAARDHAQACDWMHAALRYGAPQAAVQTAAQTAVQAGLRVLLHASALAADSGLRFLVHGTCGSYTKHGLDTQEAQLRAGERPRAFDSHDGAAALPRVLPDAFGVDHGPGVLRLPQAKVAEAAHAANAAGAADVQTHPAVAPEARWPAHRGNYFGFWAALRAALRGVGANPVPPADGMRVMALIEHGIQSATERREVVCIDPCSGA